MWFRNVEDTKHVQLPVICKPLLGENNNGWVDRPGDNLKVPPATVTTPHTASVLSPPTPLLPSLSALPARDSLSQQLLGKLRCLFLTQRGETSNVLCFRLIKPP